MTAEANVCSPSLNDRAKYPFLASRIAHNEIQAVTV